MVGLIEQTKGRQKGSGHLQNSCSDEEQDMVVKPDKIMDLLMTDGGWQSGCSSLMGVEQCELLWNISLNRTQEC